MRLNDSSGIIFFFFLIVIIVRRYFIYRQEKITSGRTQMIGFVHIYFTHLFFFSCIPTCIIKFSLFLIFSSTFSFFFLLQFLPYLFHSPPLFSLILFFPLSFHISSNINLYVYSNVAHTNYQSVSPSASQSPSLTVKSLLKVFPSSHPF